MAPAKHRAAEGRVGDVLKELKDANFVGRRHECGLFSQFVEGTLSGRQVLHVHGPAGSGKSTLLDAFRRMCESSGITYAYFDGREPSQTPDELARQVARRLGLDAGGSAPLEQLADELGREDVVPGPSVVLAFDSPPSAAPPGDWFRTAFVARLPRRVRVVSAGRHPLEGGWTESNAWRHLVLQLPIEAFPFPIARELLQQNGVQDPGAQGAIWRSTRGLPYAISLALDAYNANGAGILEGLHDQPIMVQGLTRLWFAEVPDAKLQTVVEAAAVAPHFDSDTLEAVLGQALSAEDFDRLTGLSFAHYDEAGWALDALARDSVVRGLRRRSPRRYDEQQRRALEFFVRRALETPDETLRHVALSAACALTGDPVVTALYGLHAGYTHLRIDTAGPDDAPAIRNYLRRTNPCRTIELHMDGAVGPQEMPWTIPAEELQRARDVLDVERCLDIGELRLLRDPEGTLFGFTVALPINSHTLGSLNHDPVAKTYFRHLGTKQRAYYAESKQASWFLRHFDLAPEAGTAGAVALLRDFVRYAAGLGHVVASTPHAPLERLLRHMGFVAVPGAGHSAFQAPGTASTPTYLLDLSGEHLAQHLGRALAYARSRSAGGTAMAEAAAPVDAADLAVQQLAAGAPSHRSHVPVAKSGPPSSTPASPAHHTDLLTALTPREYQVALAVADGLTNGGIAKRLFVTETTVKKHLTSIYGKVGASSRTQLTRLMMDRADAH